MRIWIIYVDGEKFYSTCISSDAFEMYEALVKKFGKDRLSWESKMI